MIWDYEDMVQKVLKIETDSNLSQDKKYQAIYNFIQSYSLKQADRESLRRNL